MGLKLPAYTATMLGPPHGLNNIFPRNRSILIATSTNTITSTGYSLVDRIVMYMPEDIGIRAIFKNKLRFMGQDKEILIKDGIFRINHSMAVMIALNQEFLTVKTFHISSLAKVTENKHSIFRSYCLIPIVNNKSGSYCFLIARKIRKKQTKIIIIEPY